MKPIIISTLIFFCPIQSQIFAEKPEANVIDLFQNAQLLYEDGKLNQAQDMLKGLDQNQIADSAYLCILAANIHYGLGNKKLAFELLDSGLKSGNEIILLPRIALLKSRENEFDWLGDRRDKLLQCLSKSSGENRRIIFEAIYSWALKQKNVDLLKSCMRLISDEEIQKDKQLAKLVVGLHRAYLNVVYPTK
jgi:hypothetical protein